MDAPPSVPSQRCAGGGRWRHRILAAIRRLGWSGLGGKPTLDVGQLTVPVHAITPSNYVPTEHERTLRQRDEWFFNHYVVAARVVAQSLALRTPSLGNPRILDFGCGDGMMALGVQEATKAEVVGLDLTRAFDVLRAKLAMVMPGHSLPEQLKFVQGLLGEDLPFDKSSFDAIYSWSVFEHVNNVPVLLAELLRILKPGGTFFLQVEPLYYSPFGSHLRRLLDQPWAHLLYDEANYLEKISHARAYVSDKEKDAMFQNNEFEAVKRYLLSEYKTLNKIRSHELVKAVLAAGFDVCRCEIRQASPKRIPPGLLVDYSAHDLRTNEIRLILRRP